MIFGVRHGERGDCSKDEKDLVEMPYDPHLTKKGAIQAKIAGKEIQKRITAYEEKSGSKITPVIMCSPFLRTIQTAYHISTTLDNFFEKTIYLDYHLSELMKEFNEDPLPKLFSNLYEIQELEKYNLFFKKEKILLERNPFQHPDLIYPQLGESDSDCNKRIAKWLELMPKLFFNKFDPKKYALIWISHAAVLAGAVCHYSPTDAAKNFSWKNIGYCGIVEVLNEDPLKVDNYQLITKGDNNFLKEE